MSVHAGNGVGLSQEKDPGPWQAGKIEKRKGESIMTIEKSMNGFTFYLNHKDYFVVTDRKNKTAALAEKVLLLIGCPVTPGNTAEILRRMRKAVCDLCFCEWTNRLEKHSYDIHGDGFGGIGSWVDDGETILLYVD